MGTIRALAILTVGVVVGISSTPVLADGPVPTPDHVVVVVMENHSFSEITEGGDAPFITDLARRGAMFTHSYAVAHPSQPNYFALFSGATHGIADNSLHALDAPTLAGKLRSAGKSFVGYVEQGSPRKHKPWDTFGDAQGVEQDVTAFPSDFNKLPTISFVIPNDDHNMHDGSIEQGDAWLKQYLGSYAEWCATHNDLLVLTFDEDDGRENNHILTVFVGGSVRSGRYYEPITHYRLLRTLEAMHRLSPLGHSAQQTPITDIWHEDSVLIRATQARPASADSSPSASDAIKHYEYVFPDGHMYVYDMDRGHALVKHESLPTGGGVRGVVGDAKSRRLYISFGSDGDTGGRLLAYDLVTDEVVWQKSYSSGIDSMALTPDGTKLYMPAGEASRSPHWYVINAADGSEIGVRIKGGPGAHNTIISLNGQRVYMGARNFSDRRTVLTIADVATNGNIRHIGPFASGIRPFTINGRETLAYVTTTGLLGFQVAEIGSGEVIYTVDLTKLGFLNRPGGPSAPSHGIALSPDETRVALIDWPNDMVHIFDVSGVPASAPKTVADIKLTRSMHHDESPCAYDCLADGWLQYSRDGRFLYVGDAGDVIDTTTNKTIINLDALYNSRKMIEVDWENGAPLFIPTNRASIGYIAD